jgi:thioredoxin
LVELDIMAREIAGELTVEQAAEERKLVAARLKAEAEEKAKAEAEGSHLPVKLTQETFVAEISQSEIPVLVDFWAEWCGPCKQVSPILDELSKTFAGKIKFAKVNVDEEPVIAGQLQIQSIPTLVIFFQGQIADMIVGALPKAQLQARLQQIVEAVARFQARQNPAKPAASSNGEKVAPASTPAQAQPTNRPNLVVSPYNLPPTPPRRPRGR